MRAETTYAGLSKRARREPIQSAVRAERDSVVASTRVPDEVKARIVYWLEQMHGERSCASYDRAPMTASEAVLRHRVDAT